MERSSIHSVMRGLCWSEESGRRGRERSRRSFCLVAGNLRLVARNLRYVMGLALLSGCGPDGPELFPARGIVLFENEPVADASVMFYPEQGRPAFARTDELGEFSLMTYTPGDGVRSGSYQVTVAKIVPQQPPTEENPYPHSKHMLPRFYSKLGASGLMADVEAGQENYFEFALEAEPGR